MNAPPFAASRLDALAPLLAAVREDAKVSELRTCNINTTINLRFHDACRRHFPGADIRDIERWIDESRPV